tara:strand:- start:896 stop:1294 length:399 start_codon:yes stop_codon:yes gene_type:complete
MIAIAALIGAVCGVLLVGTMKHHGMLAERSGAAILLAAMAVFYPVFSVMVLDPLAILLHIAVFAGFAVLCLRGFHLGLHVIAAGFIAHGLFDIIIGVIHITGPAWWPAFSAGVTLAAGTLILRLIQNGKLTR